MTGPQIVPEAKEIKRLKMVAKEHFDAIVSASALTSTNSLRIGYHAFRLKQENLFGVLGFADESEAREAAGVGASTWYENIRLAEAFKDVQEAKFVAMKQANAKALADMPESMRNDSQWLKDASHKSIKDFAAMVDEAMAGKARASDSKEASTAIKLSMPTSRKKVIEVKAKEYAVAHGIKPDDMGKIFESMCVETTGGATLSGAIANAVQRVKAMKEMVHSGISADEALVKVEAELDEMVLDFNAALEQVLPQERAA
jgi:hypothetical protein